MIVDYLVNGAIQASMLVAVAFVLSRFIRDIVGRSLLVFVLFGAAFMYIVFAVRAGESGYWIVGELAGVGVYGAMALRGAARLAVVARRGVGGRPNGGPAAPPHRGPTVLSPRRPCRSLPDRRHRESVLEG